MIDDERRTTIIKAEGRQFHKRRTRKYDGALTTVIRSNATPSEIDGLTGKSHLQGGPSGTGEGRGYESYESRRRQRRRGGGISDGGNGNTRKENSMRALANCGGRHRSSSRGR